MNGVDKGRTNAYIGWTDKGIDMNVTKKTLAEIGGYAGMALLQSATLPSIIGAIINPQTAELPPLSMVLMVWVGLLLYLVRAIVQRDKLYMLSNGIGVVLNFILLIILVFGSN
jgi:uncharacterized protein with PQ loop repeat